ncbi:MAG: ribonuclease P protein component [Rickettsiales bacterium]
MNLHKVTYSVIEKRSDFLNAFNKGKKFITPNFILQMVKREPEHKAPADDVRIGFTVTKKMGRAVKRNRIKRRLRTAVKPAIEKYALKGHDYVIISRHKAFNTDFSDLTDSMEFAFKKIIHHKNTHKNNQN